MKSEVVLTAYQRGNRDGLISFAKWAMEMYSSYIEDAERLELKACENGMLAKENVRQLITTRRWMAESFKNAADHSLRMSQSLPIDPECAEHEL